MQREIEEAVGPGAAEFLDATRLATGLMGDSIATNLFMVGFAFQRGLIPLGEAAILRAIELNGTAVETNQQSFRWGRLAAVDPARIAAAAMPAAGVPDSQRLSQSLEEIIERRAAFLVDYQDARYAQRYRQLVARVRAVESARQPGATGLTEAVARYYFKLLAIKDEYEVARLYAETDFLDRVAAQFEGNYRLSFHLAPPLLNRRDRATGEPKKSAYGPWMMSVFRMLARLRRVRGTPFDFFGLSEQRRRERALIGEYEATLEDLLAKLSPPNHELAVAIASIPEHIRGYGHVRERHMKEAKVREATLLTQFRAARSPAMQRDRIGAPA
jgi:indolepyruvate ferredoxin oxidoreductase